MLLRAEDVEVSRLGPGRFESPLVDRYVDFADERRRVLVCRDTRELAAYAEADLDPPSFEAAGPRRTLFFDPTGATCGIVTCGGLCPGLNDVIRSIVLSLYHGYRARPVVGFRYGYSGLTAAAPEPLVLTPELVEHAHETGGTMLGSSRGPQPLDIMIDTLVRRDIQVLFAIGGDGTLRGASRLARELLRRELPIAVVGIPKTIDNDLQWVIRSFGFSTAVEEARRAIAAAHTEARGAWNGIGLVKLMGRHSGFIAAHATLSNPDVNFCLVPEVPFELDGATGFLAALERRLEAKHHAVVVVAEGAGQELLAADRERGCDASGNVRLGDVGSWLHDRIHAHFTQRGTELTIKYIDPSYIIRSLPANALDSEYCLRLGQHAVHAGMLGATDVMVGFWNQSFTHVPLELATGERCQLDPHHATWLRVLEATGQPACLASS